MNGEDILHVVVGGDGVHVLYMRQGQIIRIDPEKGEVHSVIDLPTDERIKVSPVHTATTRTIR